MLPLKLIIGEALKFIIIKLFLKSFENPAICVLEALQCHNRMLFILRGLSTILFIRVSKPFQPVSKETFISLDSAGIARGWYRQCSI